jgi:hypothetical protein
MGPKASSKECASDQRRTARRCGGGHHKRSYGSVAVLLGLDGTLRCPQRSAAVCHRYDKDLLLQVIDLQKSKAVEARDTVAEQLRVAVSERDEAVQQLFDLRTAHEAASEAAACKTRCSS